MNGIKILAVIVSAVLLVIVCLYTTPLSNIYCCAMEPMWMKAKTRQELESRLFAFYQCYQIEPDPTYWGEYQLKNGERMFRYLIFDKEPLDVVVAEDGRLIATHHAYD